MTSDIRTSGLIALALVALATGDAQARDIRLPRRPTVVAAEIRTMEAPAPNPVTTGAVDHSVTPTVPASVAEQGARPARAPEIARVTNTAEPWCRSGRTAGSGAGFCLIN